MYLFDSKFIIYTLLHQVYINISLIDVVCFNKLNISILIKQVTTQNHILSVLITHKLLCSNDVVNKHFFNNLFNSWTYYQIG